MAGTGCSRERLASLFWPGHGADAARRNLRKVLFRLREIRRYATGPKSPPAPCAGRVPTDLQHLQT
jgi:hypothetical protein